MKFTKSLVLLLILFQVLYPAIATSKPKENPKNKPIPKASETQLVKIAYLAQDRVQPVQTSNLDPFVADPGLSGAQLAITDNNTTGQFTKQRYELLPVRVASDGDLKQAFESIDSQISLVIVNVSASQLNMLADLPAARERLLFDVGTRDDELRGSQCRHQVLHLLPTRAMRADALAQYLNKKRWQKWFLVTGPNPEDAQFATALKRAAKRFNHKIVHEKVWDGQFDLRRGEQMEIPTFTQVDDYDVLIVADEQGVFGEYLDYRTWLPRPVMGSQGLVATAWHPTHENWGAVQLQNRFKQLAGRAMTEEDYAAYLAVRAIGEASVRSKSNQLQTIRDYLMSPAFALQGYKGVPLSFRSWDGQLRQPLLLSAPRSAVAVAPVDGFLHPKTELDTLGYDQPETLCK